MSLNSTAQPTTIDASSFEKSPPLFVGSGIVIEGTIRHEGVNADERLVILGKVVGNIFSKGILHVERGATVHALSSIDCEQIVLAGSITGDAGVTVRAKLLVLQATGNLAVDTVCLPPGGLEQRRGGVLNARLDMSLENGSAVDVEKVVAVVAIQPQPTVALATSKVSLSLMASRDAIKPVLVAPQPADSSQDKLAAGKASAASPSALTDSSDLVRSASTFSADGHIPGITKMSGLPLGNLTFSAVKPEDYKAVELPSDSAKSISPAN